ncbi:hypothetical protein [Absidia glauca]|uniref:Uncharacterized protein n=1 Tax=Absidia glauca TaxID=4829 RepID=A0A163J2W3_ABSGL|nr:hypothetical protein [Absidia glauca]
MSVGPVAAVDGSSLLGKAKYYEHCAHFIPMGFKERLGYFIAQARSKQGRTEMTEDDFVVMLNQNEATRKFVPLIYDKATDIWNTNQGIKAEGGINHRVVSKKVPYGWGSTYKVAGGDRH